MRGQSVRRNRLIKAHLEVDDDNDDDNDDDDNVYIATRQSVQKFSSHLVPERFTNLCDYSNSS